MMYAHGVYLDDLEILDRYTLVTILAGHLLVLEYSGGVGVGGHRTDYPVGARTVSHGALVGVPSLYGAGEARGSLVVPVTST